MHESGSFPSEQDIVEHLDKVLHTEGFVNANRMKRLLTYLVHSYLSDSSKPPSGRQVGIDVFDRGEDFDPGGDPIVRVQVGRLRQLLELYYAHNEDDTIEIEIPKGGYGIQIKVKSDSEALQKETLDQGTIAQSLKSDSKEDRLKGVVALLSSRSGVLVSVFLLAGGVLLGMNFFGDTLKSNPINHSEDTGLSRHDDAFEIKGPTVFVSQYELINDDDLASRFQSGFKYQLIDKLSRFRELGVYGAVVVPSENDEVSQDNAEQSDFVLSGGISVRGDSLQVFTSVVHRLSGRVVWSDVSSTIVENIDDLSKVEEEIADGIARQLGQDTSVLNSILQAEISNGNDLSHSEFMCLRSFHDYENSVTEKTHARVRKCLEEIVVRHPNYSPAWVALSWMYGDEFRYGFNVRAHEDPPFVRAKNAAIKAIEIDPQNARAHHFLAVALFHLEDDVAFRMISRKAIELNPNHADTLAMIGLYSCLLDEVDYGRELVSRAINYNPNTPFWYNDGMAICSLIYNDIDEALASSDHADYGGTFISMMIRVAVLRQAGKLVKADELYDKIALNWPDHFAARKERIRAWRLNREIEDLMLGKQEITQRD